VKSPLLAATTLLSALVWTIALVVDSEPFAGGPALLIGVGLLATATVATVGMIVVGGRWAHRLGLASLGISVVLAVLRDIDFMWVAGTAMTALALVAVLSPGLTDTIRQLPGASGPPPRAITPPLILLTAPAVLGFVGNDATAWALLVVGLSAPNVAFLYSRVLPGGLVAIRLVWPIMTLAMTPLLGWAAGSTAAVLAIAVGVSAWDRAVKASYHPPQEAGSALRIPPELTPKEVLDAAQIDDKGRRR
jgi:hypothetical protein